MDLFCRATWGVDLIPVEEQPEPVHFQTKVRRKGIAFLQKFPNRKDFQNHEYWRDALSDLYDAYGGICAYSAQWIPRDQGSATVDHFIPKAVNRKLAYEWRNYRLATLTMNGRKSEFQDILDPFTLGRNWFMLDFPSLLIKPNPDLAPRQKGAVDATIKRLKLNDDDRSVKSRQDWIMPYCEGKYDFDHLKKRVPFIASELERQNLVDNIASMMVFPS